MDLVDRKEILRMLNENYIVFRGEFEKMPSVEAVPLEPLCEWLQDNASLTHGTLISAAGWKYELTRWMEEQK